MSDQPTINETTLSKRRFDRGAWLTLIIALSFVCIILWNTIGILTLPGDGWQVAYTDADSITPSWPLRNFIGDWQTPLQANDIVLAIEDLEIANQLPIARWTLPDGWHEGGAVHYTVLRAGQTVNIDVALHRLGMAGVLRGLWRTMRDAPAEWIWLVVGLVVFFLRPRDRAAQLLLIVGVSQNMVTKVAWAGTTLSANFAPPILHTLRFLIVSFWAPIFWPSITFLTLSFPTRIFPLTRYPRAVPWLLYGLPTGITLYILITGFLGIATLLLAIQALVMFLAFGAALYNVIRHPRDTTVRAQALWVVLGLMLSIGINLPYYLLNTLGWLKSPQVEAVFTVVGPLTVLFLPVSLGIAITRYRLFDIQVIIRRTLVYTLLTGLLGALYFGGVAVLQGILTADGRLQTADEFAVSGQTLYSTPSAVVIVVTTLAVAALFNPLRKRLQNLIDRRFYRQKYDAEKALSDFAAVARSETNLPTLTGSLVSVVQETVQPEEVKLWLKP